MVTALCRVIASSAAFANVEQLRDTLQDRILGLYPDAFVLGGSARRLPTTLNVCLPGMDAEDLVDRMAARDVAISAGSACSYGARKPSYVALAHGLTYEQAKSCVRLSLSIESTDQEVEAFLRLFGQEIAAEASRFNRRRENA